MRNVVASVIVPTYRRHEYVLNTVEALLNQSRQDIEIIVADQNSCWPAEVEARRVQICIHERVRWLIIETLGVVNARHRAVEESIGEILIFIDDDVKIDDVNFIDKHLNNYEDSTIDAATGRELYNTEKDDNDNNSDHETKWNSKNLVIQTLNFSRECNKRTLVCSFCTCNASVRRDSFMSVGGFDEGFGVASYGDDYDFAIRLVQNGGKIIFDPHCALIHLKAPIGGLRMSDKRNTFSEKDKALSGLIFLLRYGSSSGCWGRLFYSWVLRRTILLRSNLLQPWRLGRVLWGLCAAFVEARKIVAAGPSSRFCAQSDHAVSSRHPDGPR